MGRESKFWTQTVKPRLVGHSQRIESPISSGTPDVVNVVKGVVSWIELKDKPKWEEALGLEKIQRYWLTRWYAEGGNAYLLARCGREMFFISARDIEISDGTSLEEFRLLSLVYSPKLFDAGHWGAVNGFLCAGRGYEPTSNALVNLF